MKIIIGSEGMGIWGNKVLIYLLNKLYPNIDIENKNTSECNFIVLSHFISIEPLWNKENKKYIYWSGECYNPDKSKYEEDCLYMTTTIQSDMNNHIYIPFVLYSNHLYKERKYTNLDRKYLLAYCNSNKITEREKIFNLFVRKTSYKLCHSYGSCYGKYLNTQKSKISGKWNDDDIIDTYKDYKFVIAMENKCVNGYITEKILNVFYSGAIPIYWGSPNINDFFNKKAFINVNDFNSFNECVDYVINMDDTKIKQMIEEPIYNENNDIINLLKNNENKILDTYLIKIKDFLLNNNET